MEKEHPSIAQSRESIFREDSGASGAAKVEAAKETCGLLDVQPETRYPAHPQTIYVNPNRGLLPHNRCVPPSGCRRERLCWNFTD